MTSLPEWAKGINEESLEKALSMGEILLELPFPDIPEGAKASKETLFVKWLKVPAKKKNPKTNEDMWVSEVEHQGARKSLITPESLRFNLLKECRLHSLDSPEGQHFVIGAHMQATKYGQSKLYWCQLHKSKASEDQPAQRLPPEEKLTFGMHKPEPPEAEEKKEEPAGSSASATDLERVIDKVTRRSKVNDMYDDYMKGKKRNASEQSRIEEIYEAFT